jgi:hypothetical protein
LRQIHSKKMKIGYLKRIRTAVLESSELTPLGGGYFNLHVQHPKLMREYSITFKSDKVRYIGNGIDLSRVFHHIILREVLEVRKAVRFFQSIRDWSAIIITVIIAIIFIKQYGLC